ncbi:MAG: rRNA maturation RNase YbeY [Chitinophagaceae bacterium]|nr:MAG: rRNA maturation RNase YbeY [Chitinophagaceae bacterium]
MISFNYETDFQLAYEKDYSDWVSAIITSEGKVEGDINYVFCDDEYLLSLNQQYLEHDTLTDIISFDYSVGDELHGDIFISVERVAENAKDFNVTMSDELKRVMAHGILHYCGYKDKTEPEEQAMRLKEEEKMKMFHVKH